MGNSNKHKMHKRVKGTKPSKAVETHLGKKSDTRRKRKHFSSSDADNVEDKKFKLNSSEALGHKTWTGKRKDAHTPASTRKTSSKKSTQAYTKDKRTTQSSVPETNKKPFKKKATKRKGTDNVPRPVTVKVQTHATLYRNPDEFSSNWKQLMKASQLNFIFCGSSEVFFFRHEPTASTALSNHHPCQ